MTLFTHIAVMATGDEVVNGDVLNTNTHYVAQKLSGHKLHIQTHLCARDQQKTLTKHLLYLMKHHEVIITIGGLGPTCDDITRESISEASKHELIFNEGAWQDIEKRMKGRVISPDNRQQAYFPKSAEIIPNHYGTASGCYLRTETHIFVMLPGPPSELIPMFDQAITPRLIQTLEPDPYFHEQLLLFQTSESQVAQLVKEAIASLSVETAYRCFTPYLQVKLKSLCPSDTTDAKHILSEHFKASLCPNNQTYIHRLLNLLSETNSQKIIIEDRATFGYLQSQLTKPHTLKNILFVSSPPETKDLFFQLKGLNEYWQSEKTTTTELIMSHKNQSQRFEIYNRANTKDIACEITAKWVLQSLEKISS